MSLRTPVFPVTVTRHRQGVAAPADDIVVVEEPLEIRLGHGPGERRQEVRLSVTMRTPGHDEELATGFLFTEGIITSRSQLLRVVPCEHVKAEERGNVVRAELHTEVELDPAKWQRNFYTTSSCGVCGKSSIDAVQAQCTRTIAPFGAFRPELIMGLPGRMRQAQAVFRHTGGIHAAALFNRQGELLLLREDVGRHNAVDKVVGAMLSGPLDALRNDLMLLVSGRAGFELVQKCTVAGLPLMAAIGAPSSLAVRMAREARLTLIGFLAEGRFNVYAGAEGQ